WSLARVQISASYLTFSFRFVSASGSSVGTDGSFTDAVLSPAMTHGGARATCACKRRKLNCCYATKGKHVFRIPGPCSLPSVGNRANRFHRTHRCSAAGHSSGAGWPRPYGVVADG